MISEILSPNITVNNMINNGFYAKSETFGGNGRRTPTWGRGGHRSFDQGFSLNLAGGIFDGTADGASAATYRFLNLSPGATAQQ